MLLLPRVYLILLHWNKLYELCNSFGALKLLPTRLTLPPTSTRRIAYEPKVVSAGWGKSQNLSEAGETHAGTIGGEGGLERPLPEPHRDRERDAHIGELGAHRPGARGVDWRAIPVPSGRAAGSEGATSGNQPLPPTPHPAGGSDGEAHHRTAPASQTNLVFIPCTTRSTEWSEGGARFGTPQHFIQLPAHFRIVQAIGAAEGETTPLCARGGLNSVPSPSPYQNQPQKAPLALQLLY